MYVLCSAENSRCQIRSHFSVMTSFIRLGSQELPPVSLFRLEKGSRISSRNVKASVLDHTVLS